MGKYNNRKLLIIRPKLNEMIILPDFIGMLYFKKDKDGQ